MRRCVPSFAFLQAGELAVFNEGLGVLSFTAGAAAPVQFMLGSAVKVCALFPRVRSSGAYTSLFPPLSPPSLCVTKHPHALHLGRYSVHTSAANLAAGEAEIRRVGTLLKQQGIL